MTTQPITGSAFPANLRMLRQQYALSRMALARLTGISQHYLKRIEQETVTPELPREVLERMAQIFCISVETLIGENPPQET